MPVKKEDIKADRNYFVLNTVKYSIREKNYDLFTGDCILRLVDSGNNDYAFYDSRLEWLNACKARIIESLEEIQSEINEIIGHNDNSH